MNQFRLADWQKTTRWDKGETFSEVAKAQHAVEKMYNQSFDKEFVFCFSHHYKSEMGKSRLFEDLQIFNDTIHLGQENLLFNDTENDFFLMKGGRKEFFKTLDQFLTATFLLTGKKLIWKGKALEYLHLHSENLV